MHEIAITDRQRTVTLDAARLEEVAERVLDEEGIAGSTISLVFVDDPEIHQINRDHLQHDYPTDVISFLLDSRDGGDEGDGSFLDGEIIVSTETAAREAAKYDWSPADEIVLYVVHGLLHLTGYDDLSTREKRLMRGREAELLACWGLEPHYDEQDDPPPQARGTDDTAPPAGVGS